MLIQFNSTQYTLRSANHNITINMNHHIEMIYGLGAQPVALILKFVAPEIF